MRFEEILVLVTAITGIICVINYFYQKKQNKQIITGKNGWIIECSKSFFPVFLIVLVLRSFLYEPFRIPSGSMKPTLLEGDFIIVNKFDYGIRLPILGTKILKIGNPKTGDIIVFRHSDGKDLIKRVVGVPGDHIRYENNQLFINGKPASTKFLQLTKDGGTLTIESIEHLNKLEHNIYIYPQRVQKYPYNDVIVPADSYFVLGDNRNNSEDGRFWGFVPDKDIMGRAFATWLSWDHEHHDVRWSRFGKSIYKYESDNNS